MATNEERLARLEAVADIKELTARYCWHVARGEGAAIVELFTEDGVLDGSASGMDVVRGREALLQFYREAVREPGMAIPFIHNHIIEVDGDHAHGSCALDARFVRRRATVAAAGYYLDTYRRRAGRWLFAERQLFFQLQVPISAVDPG